MVVERPVAEVMTSPVFSVRRETPLQEAVTLLSSHHISGLPVVDEKGILVGELSEKDLMVRESGFDAGPYVMFLDAVIYLRNPLEWNRQVHQVLGSTVGDVMSASAHTCPPSTTLPQAARLLNDRRIQRLFVVNDQGNLEGVLTRGDVVRALAEAG
ncbi:MAG: CBS domain-containing protein [Cyanobacteriota bacterium]|nr:CBS domain-containing protein [Cyanobacteriota bacterium]